MKKLREDPLKFISSILRSDRKHNNYSLPNDVLYEIFEDIFRGYDVNLEGRPGLKKPSSTLQETILKCQEEMLNFFRRKEEAVKEGRVQEQSVKEVEVFVSPTITRERWNSYRITKGYCFPNGLLTLLSRAAGIDANFELGVSPAVELTRLLENKIDENQLPSEIFYPVKGTFGMEEYQPKSERGHESNWARRVIKELNPIFDKKSVSLLTFQKCLSSMNDRDMFNSICKIPVLDPRGKGNSECLQIDFSKRHVVVTKGPHISLEEYLDCVGKDELLVELAM